MVGKPNFPSDVDVRSGLHGMANPTAGLSALDEEREASMADEGGMSGAVMEREDPCEGICEPTDHRPFPLVHKLEHRLGPAAMRDVALVLGFGLGCVLLGAALRR
jgi:hypothetical protein